MTEDSTSNETMLYHGTSSAKLQEFLAKGISSPSSWAGSYEMGLYYAIEAAEEAGDDKVVVLAIPVTRFNTEALTPDSPSIQEPITTLLDDDEDTLYQKWKEAEGTWQDCLQIFSAVCYKGETPLLITEADIYNTTSLEEAEMEL